MTNQSLRELAGKATPVEPRDLMAYEHGGGRLAILRDGKRDLIADFYGDGHDRDYYAALSPSTVLALLDRVEALEAALKPFAKLAEEMAENTKPDDWISWGYNDADLLYGDFRRARALLNPQEAAKL